jgi:hypothetical protein
MTGAVIAERIDVIFDYLKKEGLDHSSIPHIHDGTAHYVTKN